MDRMRIAEQRKEVLIATCKFFIFPKSINLYVCYTYIDRKAIVRLMEEGFGERVWSFRAVKA